FDVLEYNSFLSDHVKFCFLVPRTSFMHFFCQLRRDGNECQTNDGDDQDLQPNQVWEYSRHDCGNSGAYCKPQSVERDGEYFNYRKCNSQNQPEYPHGFY